MSGRWTPRKQAIPKPPTPSKSEPAFAFYGDVFISGHHGEDPLRRHHDLLRRRPRSPSSSSRPPVPFRPPAVGQASAPTATPACHVDGDVASATSPATSALGLTW